MLSEARTITFITEAIHLPVAHAPERLRQLYGELCKSCGYENFTRTSSGARIERPAGDTAGLGSLTISRDRIQVFEDDVRVPVDQFARQLEEVARTAMGVLRIPFFLVQQCTVRAIATPMSFPASSQFLGERLFSIGAEEVAVLGRPATLFGFRMIFPPTREAPHTFNVRVEAYTKDPKSVYMENSGTFNSPVDAKGLEALGRNMQATSDFITNRLCAFLSQFDRR